MKKIINSTINAYNPTELRRGFPLNLEPNIYQAKKENRILYSDFDQKSDVLTFENHSAVKS